MDRHQAHPADRARGAHPTRRKLTSSAEGGAGAGPGQRVAFDLDGTLVDARLRQVGVAREALARVTGEQLDERAFWRAKRAGANTWDALERLGCSARIADQVAERWGERIEAEDWVTQDRALPGARRALTALARRGAEITVITARSRAEGAERSLCAAGLDAWVDELVVVAPTRAVVEKAAALMRCGAFGFVGDTESDGAACTAAGLPYAAVATGQRSPSYLRRRGFEPHSSLGAAIRSLGADGWRDR